MVVDIARSHYLTTGVSRRASASAVELVALALTIQSLRSIGDQWLTAILFLRNEVGQTGAWCAADSLAPSPRPAISRPPIMATERSLRRFAS
jgi:hypothetical protein